MPRSTFRYPLLLLVLALVGGACELPRLGAGEDGCLNGSDCADGLRCIRGTCTVPVSEAADCSAWDDPFEDNDSQGEARPVPLSAVHGLKLCEGDEDWFAVEELLEKDVVTVRVVATAGPAPSVLELSGPEGAMTPDDSSRGSSKAEAVYTIAAAGRHTVRVADSELAVPVDYWLELELAERCAEDENSTRETAADLPGDGPATGTLCGPEDASWWRVTLSEGDALEADATGDDGMRSLDVAVFSADGEEPVASGSGSVALEASPAGDYLLRVGGAPERLEYELTVRQCKNDDGEPANDEAGTASVLLADEPAVGAICPGDEDWFVAPSLGARDTLTVGLDYSLGGELSVAVYDPDHLDADPMGQAEGQGGRAQVEVTVADTMAPLVHVSAVAAARGAYTVTARVTCAPDANTSRELAVDLPEDGVATGRLCSQEAEAWWRVQLGAGDALTASAATDPGGEDLLVALYADAEEVALAEGEGSAALPASAAGTYLVRVSDPAARADYRLDVTRCDNDDAEPTNDDPATAAPVEGEAGVEALLCPGDADVYVGPPLLEGDRLEARLTWADLGADPELAVLDPDAPNDDPLAKQSGDNGELVLGWDAVRTMVPLVRVGPGDTLQGSYTLSLQATCDPDDGQPANDDPATAPELAFGVPLVAELCPGDADWYALGGLLPGDEIDVVATAWDAVGAKPVLELWDPDDLGGQALAAAVDSDEPPELTYQADAVISPLLHLTGAGPLRGEYTLLVTLRRAACDPDAGEPANDEPVTAPELAFDDPLEAGLCPGDEDWHAVPGLVAGDTLDVEATWNGVGVQPVLELWDTDDLEGEPLTAADGADGPLELSHLAAAAFDPLVRVTGAGLRRGDYTLEATVQFGACDPAVDEPDNDDAATAPDALLDAPLEWTLCPGDEDWLRAPLLLQDDELVVEVTYEAIGGDPDVELWDPEDLQGAPLQTVTGSEGRAELRWNAADAGQPLVRVTAQDDLRGEYTLTLTEVRAGCEDQLGEPDNDDPETAPLLVQQLTIGQLCPEEEDWWATAELAAGDTLQVQLTYAGWHTDPTLELWPSFPFPAEAVALDSVVGDSGLASLSRLADAAGSFLVVVRGSRGTRGSYSLNVTVEPDDQPVCPAGDDNEPNDEWGDAAPVEELVTSVSGVACADDADWFVVSRAPGSGIRVELSYDEAEGSAGLALYDSVLQPLAMGQAAVAPGPEDPDVVAEATVPNDGSFYAVVAQIAAGDGFAYDLELVEGDPPDGGFAKP